MLVIPNFTEYRRALESVGAEIHTTQLDELNHFRPPLISRNTDVVILSNPNNPAGAYAPPEEMIEWISRFPTSTHVLVDEAFVEFTAQPSIVKFIERFPNLWVLRSMTKFYALPGLRLGYLVGSGIPFLANPREPWQVNTLAVVAGIASLADHDYEESTLQLVQHERIWLWKQLQRLASIHAFPTSANFFLARCENDKSLDCFIATLMERNILIRDCRTIEGLEGPYFRFAIKGRAENAQLLDHMRTI